MIKRDVKQEYEHEWSQSIKWIKDKHRIGVKDPVQIISEYNTFAVNRFFKNPNFGLHYLKDKNVLADGMTLLVKDGSYVLKREIDYYDRLVYELVDFISKHAKHISDIVELGSGIGRNLFLLSNELSLRNLKHFTYHACEFTDSGREATKLLSEGQSVSPLKIHYFDYYRPDFSFLVDSKGVFFFSVLSIEQIPEVPDIFIDEIIKYCKNCYCIHFEPIGWQYDKNCKRLREFHDSYLGKFLNVISAINNKVIRMLDKIIGTSFGAGVRTISKSSVQLGKSENVSINAAKWSSIQQYNKNYYVIISF